jgi:hypothetical protein
MALRLLSAVLHQPVAASDGDWLVAAMAPAGWSLRLQQRDLAAQAAAFMSG